MSEDPTSGAAQIVEQARRRRRFTSAKTFRDAVRFYHPARRRLRVERHRATEPAEVGRHLIGFGGWHDGWLYARVRIRSLGGIAFVRKTFFSK